MNKDELEAKLAAVEKERERWEQAAFRACAGIVCTPEKPGKTPCRPGLLIELRELCEARGKELAGEKRSLERARDRIRAVERERDGAIAQRDILDGMREERDAAQAEAARWKEEARTLEKQTGSYCYCGLGNDACDGWKYGLCDSAYTKAPAASMDHLKAENARLREEVERIKPDLQAAREDRDRIEEKRGRALAENGKLLEQLQAVRGELRQANIDRHDMGLDYETGMATLAALLPEWCEPLPDIEGRADQVSNLIAGVRGELEEARGGERVQADRADANWKACEKAEARAERLEKVINDCATWMEASIDASDKTQSVMLDWFAAFSETWVPRLRAAVEEN